MRRVKEELDNLLTGSLTGLLVSLNKVLSPKVLSPLVAKTEVWHRVRIEKVGHLRANAGAGTSRESKACLVSRRLHGSKGRRE